MQVLLADASGFQPFCHKQEQDEPRLVGPWTPASSHPSHSSITSCCVREVELVCGNKEAKGKASNIAQRATLFEGRLLVVDIHQSIPELRAPVVGNIGKLFHIAGRWEVEETSTGTGQTSSGTASVRNVGAEIGPDAETGREQRMTPPRTPDLQPENQLHSNAMGDPSAAAVAAAAAAAAVEDRAAAVATPPQGPRAAPQLGPEPANDSCSPTHSSTPAGGNAEAQQPTAATWVAPSSSAAASEPMQEAAGAAVRGGGTWQVTWRVYAAVRCSDKCPGALKGTLQSAGIADLKKRFPKRMELARAWLEHEEQRLSMQLVLPGFRPPSEWKRHRHCMRTTAVHVVSCSSAPASGGMQLLPHYRLCRGDSMPSCVAELDRWVPDGFDSLTH
jgi:hypothetical protein